jgi:hypothetical protein
MPAPQSATIWTVQPGPFGRGDCLTKREAAGDILIVAPPGVPLAAPEAAADLLCWRSAKWASGKITAAPRTLTLDDALDRVPEQRSWLLAQAAEQRCRDEAAKSERRPPGAGGTAARGGSLVVLW